jgi:hypothetical protein
LEHKGGFSESSTGVEIERSVYLFKGNWAATIGDYFAENCRHQCMGQVSFCQHEYVFHRLRFVTLWVGVLGPIQRDCASSSNRIQQFPPISIRLKTTLLKRSDQIGVNVFFQLTVIVQDSDRVPIRESGVHNALTVETNFFLHRSGFGGERDLSKIMIDFNIIRKNTDRKYRSKIPIENTDRKYRSEIPIGNIDRNIYIPKYQQNLNCSSYQERGLLFQTQHLVSGTDSRAITILFSGIDCRAITIFLSNER